MLEKDKHYAHVKILGLHDRVDKRRANGCARRSYDLYDVKYLCCGDVGVISDAGISYAVRHSVPRCRKCAYIHRRKDTQEAFSAAMSQVLSMPWGKRHAPGGRPWTL